MSFGPTFSESTSAVPASMPSAIITGSGTNDNATIGYIGEFLTSTIDSGNTVSLSNVTTANVTSLMLTPGDWEVSGAVYFVLSGVTGSLFQCGISLTSATLPSQQGTGGLGTDALSISPISIALLSNTVTQYIPTIRVNIGVTSTIYLVARQTFTLGASSVYGSIRARRIR